MSSLSWNRALRVVMCTGLFALTALSAPVQAARPLLDQHQWDRDFALFARDSSVPWRTTTVRLETYSSAPVDFDAYAVDAADVIVANHPQGRAYSPGPRHPVAHWRFLPPPGYRVEGNTVSLPLGEREGIFVIQARRGSAIQQVWVNRTRIGLVSKEAPEGLMLYGTDLANGHPLSGMRLLFLIGQHLESRMTDRSGIVRWNGSSRPRFVLAEWGQSRAFLSFLPQAPVPGALAAVRVDRSVVRGGEELNVVGFARRRQGHHYTPVGGVAHISLFMHGHMLATSSAPVDSAGSFNAHIAVPNVAKRGNATVLVNVGNASAGVGVEIEASENITLAITSECATHCRPDQAVPLLIIAKRGELPAALVPLRISVVRFPHIFPPGTTEFDQESWGATTVVQTTQYTNESGHIRVTVPASADGLPSTLGIDVLTGSASASASTRVELPNSAVALVVHPEHDHVNVGQSVGVQLRAFGSDDGRPVSGSVHVVLTHGPNHSDQTVTLDEHGRGRALFARPQFGDNLITATLTSSIGTASDANSVSVEPKAFSSETPQGVRVSVHTDRARYHTGDQVTIDADAGGAVGSTLLSIDDRRTGNYRVVPVANGNVHGAVALGDPQGNVEAAVAYVRHGALFTGSVPLDIDGPGHEKAFDLAPDASSYAGGATAHIRVQDGTSNRIATTVIRMTDAPASGAADFNSAGDILATGGVTTQVSASDDPPWHAWVSPQHSRATDLFADLTRRPGSGEPPTLSDAAARVLYWNVERIGDTLSVVVPKTSGRYVLSVMRMYDDGDVGASTTVLEVQ
jgi:hypothetical protein